MLRTSAPLIGALGVRYKKRFVDFSHNQFAIGCAPVEEANVLRYRFIGGEHECRESESKNWFLAVGAH